MKTKIGVIGFSHRETTLSDSIIRALSETKKEVEEIQEILEEEQSMKTTKTIMEIIEEQKSFQIKNTLMDFKEVKCGKENRRERRARERKAK